MTGKTYLYSLFTIVICLFSIRTYSQQLPKREFRGVWVATIGNIDWPSVKAGNNVAQQKQEFIDLLDQHRSAGLNAIILQVRPAADAFYAKGREPWSRYLTGKQGVPPSPFYDPLEFAITEAHKRGMELHAWFNPYRASTTLNPAHFSDDHITKRHPEWFFTYAGKKLFNPGIPQVRKYIIDVIMDVVKNYDVDGIHFDDYFYPYPDSRNTPVPDQITFGQYNNGIEKIDDWRRNNVNLLVHDLGIAIKKIKPYVKYGISPCGVWDNKDNNSDGSDTRGLSAYRELYADGVKWMQEGWIDYINPQIYFPFKNRAAAYEILVDWWQKHTYGRHFYVGHGAYRVTENKIGWTDRSQIPRQVRHLREEHDVEGSIYFSSKSLTDNLVGLQDSMRNDLYRTPALPPTMPWLDSIPPNVPFGLLVKNSVNGKMNTLFWQKPDAATDGESAYGYVIYRFNLDEKVNIKDPGKIIFITFDGDKLQYTDDDIKQHQHYKYVVTAIDRMKNESIPSDSRTANEEI